MNRAKTYSVSEVARASGTTVRTLHHYDEIGLLVPRSRSRAGYRRYDDADMLRLQQILLGRELGLSLEVIRRQLDDPSFDYEQALLAQRSELQRRAETTAAMLRAIDAALSRLKEKQRRSDMKELFDGFDAEAHEDEARARWGKTDAYRESKRRTQSYGKEQWEALKQEQVDIYGALAALDARGVEPDSVEAMDAAERHRLSIDRWFYPCSRAMHAGLAALYEQDDRFAQNIDKHGEGLTRFLVAAIRANGKR